MKAETFFNGEDQQKISAIIGMVEKKTAGEVAVMVVDHSDTYPEAQILAGILLGGLISIGIADRFFDDSLWSFIPLAIFFAVLVGTATGYIPPIKRFFIPSSRLEDQVRTRAVRAFYEKGLHKTRDGTGVLFFISLFEHKVWILADQGIYSRIEKEQLNTFVQEIAAAIRSGNTADVLYVSIQKVGDLLARHFPVKSDDQNELPDQVFIEEG